LIPFNKPYISGKELWNIAQAHAQGQMAGDGAFTKLCNAWLEDKLGCKKALLTHSCTAALEMSAILANVGINDEIIMPSYTFVSAANAFVLRGAKPVFIDIRPDTLNLDETLIESLITPNTKAIVPMHYAGISCEMDEILKIAKKYNLLVIEDAAQALGSFYKGKPLGSIGELGTLSFHETKNIISGEGGAIIINEKAFIDRGENIREKGTNRSKFFRGMVDKYSWVDIGSSYLPGEIIAAFLWAQMEEANLITQKRLEIWNRYHKSFEEFELKGRIRRPIVPKECIHNGHIYYLLMRDLNDRTNFIETLKNRGINCVFHYVPLHNSPYAIANGFAQSEELKVTMDIADRLVRLPIWIGLDQDQDKIISCVIEYLKQ